MHKFLVRAISGIIYAAFIIAAILCGHWTIYALAILFASIGVCELLHMAIGFPRKSLPAYIIMVIQTILFISVFALSPYLTPVSIWVLTGVFLLLMWPYFVALNKVRQISLSDFSDNDIRKAPLYGIGYLGIPMAFMTICPIERLSLLVFVLLWINDSGAYIVGSLTGRHKLCPSISPNKTWEGFIGGCVLTIAGALMLDLYCDTFFRMEKFPLWIWMMTGVLTCIFGTFGDLLESKIKRFYGVKDSGNWIPGHGGILDRIDSFLLAYPIVCIFIYLFD